MFISPENEILLYRSTIPVLIIIEDEKAIKEQMDEAIAVEQAMKKVASGEVSLWEAFEACEMLSFDFEQWLREVEWHLEYEFNRDFGDYPDF